MELSVCMLVKDHAAQLTESLPAIKDAFGHFGDEVELVITDLGSTDGSIELERLFTDKVFPYNYRGDISSAGNYCVKKAESDRILFLNPEDKLKFISDEKYRALLAQIDSLPMSVGRIMVYNTYLKDDVKMQYPDNSPRIFNRQNMIFKGKKSAVLQYKSKTGKGGSQVTYYSTEIMTDRYIPKLTSEEKARETAYNNTIKIADTVIEKETPKKYYDLGKTEYVCGEYNDCFRYLLHAMELFTDKDYMNTWYLEDLLNTLAYSSMKIKRENDALKVLTRASDLETELKQSADFMFVYGLLQMNTAHFKDAVNTFIKATKLPASRTAGTNSFMAFYNAGVICEVTGDADRATAFYEKCGDYKPALEGLERLKDQDEKAGG